jgi:hypothetical protein
MTARALHIPWDVARWLIELASFQLGGMKPTHAVFDSLRDDRCNKTTRQLHRSRLRYLAFGPLRRRLWQFDSVERIEKGWELSNLQACEKFKNKVPRVLIHLPGEDRGQSAWEQSPRRAEHDGSDVRARK